MRRFWYTLASLLAALTLAVALPSPAQAIGTIHTVAGPVISGGADGTLRTLACPVLEKAYGGGFTLSATSPWVVESWDYRVTENRPDDGANGWRVNVQAYQTDVTFAHVRLYVTCATL